MPRVSHLRAIDVFSFYGIASPNGLSFTNTAYPTANKIFYCPIRLPDAAVAKQMFCINGTGGVSGNLEMGIYSADGRRIVTTGSVAQSGSGATQVADITDTPLGAGLYYAAFALDNTTGTLLRSSLSAEIHRAMGVLMEAAGAFGLPAVATWTMPVDAYVPRYGVAFGEVL